MKKKQTSPCCVYDFTCFSILDESKLRNILNDTCKKWKFQEEKCPTTGKLHMQGRFSLKLKSRITSIPFSIGNYSVTSNANRDNFYYMEKGKTYTRGPWSDSDPVIYIPRQIREIEKLYAWQQTILDKMKIWDKRTINCVYNKTGNIGKSILVGWIRAYQLGRCLPPVNDFKDMLRMVCDLPTATSYLIDMPKAIKKDKLGGFYAAIETIKDGYAYDDRYSFKEKVFDSPSIWIFTNTLPDLTLLSEDRWRIWHVEDKCLKRWRGKLSL